MTEWIPTSGSSHIHRYRYDSGARRLEIQFKDKNKDGGLTYHYAGVGQDVAEAFHKAESKGAHFRQHIIGKFDHQKA